MSRRLATDKMREIRQAERSHRRMQADVTSNLVQREASHRQARVATESDLASGRRNREIQGKIVDTATPSSNSGLIMTTIFMIVGLVLFYQVVTKADQFSGLVRSVGDFLHKLSSTTPLFQVKEP